MIFAYKVLSEQIGLEKEDLFTLSQSSARGHNQRVIKKKAMKLCRIIVFANRIIDDWNKLPQEIVPATSITSFKNSLDKHRKEETSATQL